MSNLMRFDSGKEMASNQRYDGVIKEYEGGAGMDQLTSYWLFNK